jgi:hypothetical protein
MQSACRVKFTIPATAANHHPRVPVQNDYSGTIDGSKYSFLALASRSI